MQHQQSGPPESSLGRKLYSNWNKSMDMNLIKDKIPQSSKHSPIINTMNSPFNQAKFSKSPVESITRVHSNGKNYHDFL